MTYVLMFLLTQRMTFLFMFQLKELEKLGPKKGVISQSVKDVVQSLVDDDLVLKDKIGTSVSSFPRLCWHKIFFLSSLYTLNAWHMNIDGFKMFFLI